MSGVALDAAVHVRRARFALDARLQAAPGEVVAVMGPSGAGKSTLLEAIAGFTALTAGSVVLDGRTVQDAGGVDVQPRERGVILLSQRPGLFPHLSARENVAFGLRARRVPRHAARDLADAWLERVGLPGLGDRRPARLSGGQQQRVALARALATSPRVLLLDEPLTSLDPATADGIRSLLREELAETGTTAVLATHDAVDAVALADRLVVLESGRITADGTPADLLAQPATPFIAAVAGAGVASAGVAGPAGAWAWQALVESVESDASGIRACIRTPDGSAVELPFPAGTPLVEGAIVSIRPPS
jgi:molybdate transport system ATP-binding protein